MLLHPVGIDAALSRLRNHALSTRNPRDFADFRYRGYPNVFDISGNFDLRALFNRPTGVNDIPVYFGDFSSFGPGHPDNLVLMLMTALQRGMDRSVSSAPEPPWMDRLDEMEYQRSWRRFVMNYTGSNGARRRDLDLEAYALEAENAAHCATDLHSSTMDFIDAYVRDYESVARVSRVVFIFGFEDMHLNPTVDRALRQALRSLAHPRLAFLFARSLEENTPWPPDRPDPLTEGRNARIRAENEASRNRPPPPPPLSTWAQALLEGDDFT